MLLTNQVDVYLWTKIKHTASLQTRRQQRKAIALVCGSMGAKGKQGKAKESKRAKESKGKQQSKGK